MQCLYELDLFLKCEPLCLMPMEYHLNMGERAHSEGFWKRKCVLEYFLGWFLDRTSKTAEQEDSLFCLHHISQKHAQTLSIHSWTFSTHKVQSHKQNHSSIFYARMNKSLASFCKLLRMCDRKSGQNTLGLQRFKKEVSGEKHEKDTGKDYQKEKYILQEVRYFCFLR